MTASRGAVYVLNAEEGGSIQGYAIVYGHLVLIPYSHRSLGLTTGKPGEPEQFTHTPGQVAFSPGGSQLIVTTKAAGQSIEVFTVYPWGGLSRDPVVNSDETVPFGVTFDSQGHLLVAEAAGALASFQLNENGTLTELDSVKTNQAATCWVTPAAWYYYTSNAGSSTLTGFQASWGGQLTLLGNTKTHPGTVDGASTGDFCGTVFHFLLEKIGHSHQAPCLDSPGRSQDRRKGTGRERCCSSLTLRRTGCSSWREKPSRRSCASGKVSEVAEPAEALANSLRRLRHAHKGRALAGMHRPY